MIQVYIIRGLPGTGKTSLAQSIAHPSLIFSADDFFVARGKGSYAYDPALIGEAHSDCFKRFNDALMAQVEDFATNGGLKYHDREYNDCSQRIHPDLQAVCRRRVEGRVSFSRHRGHENVGR